MLGNKRTVQRFEAPGALLSADNNQSTPRPLVLGEDPRKPGPLFI
jgi:hypothetical protein